MTTPETLLITGGAGYIGSHLCVEALQNGYEVVVLDNLSNSYRAALAAVERVTQRTLTFIEGDLRDRILLNQVFAEHNIDVVMHLAGLKKVAKSLQDPLRYFDCNVNGSIALFECMQQHQVSRLVFSSSATVYGQAEQLPIPEDHPTNVRNPYGHSKLTIEHLLQDLALANSDWQVAILRYFNPVGAHGSGELGEDSADGVGNLMPYVSQVAIGNQPQVQVFGNNYDTRDGTGVRDYIHVMDLVQGHLSALEHLPQLRGCDVFNLGTGTGVSVLEVIDTFARVSGRRIPYEFAPRREGDLGEIYADPSKAQQQLGWRARCDLEEMCADVWRWQQRYPHGYRTPG